MIQRRANFLPLFGASLVLLICCLIMFTGDIQHAKDDNKMNQATSTSIVVDAYSSLPTVLDPALARSSAIYRSLLHLVRPLVKYNNKAQIEADLAESWEISNNFRTYRFTIRNGAQWSDGTTITAEHALKSIQRQIRLKTATHFDFSQIESADASGSILTISLRQANPHFLKAVLHPEFGVINNTETERLTAEDFKVTSGPYVLDSMTSDELVFSKNTYYPSPTDNPTMFRLRSSPIAKQIQLLLNGEVDFVVPSGPISHQQHMTLITESKVRAISPHIGYTFWLSLNPRAEVFRTKSNRLWFTGFIRSLPLSFEGLGPMWSRAEQLYLPDGFGRPSQKELENLFSGVSSKASSHAPARLRLIVSENFLWTQQIVEALKNAGVQVQLTTYKTIFEYEEHARKQDFDVIQINNDFSAPDLLENLFVTFSDTRPLVFTGDSLFFANTLKKVALIDDKEEIYRASIDIALNLLEEGLVAPIAYYNLIYYAKESLDTSRWSQIQPDLSFWKVRVVTGE